LDRTQAPQLEAVSQMPKRLLLIAGSFVLALPACSSAPAETTPPEANQTMKAPEIAFYSDINVELLVQQFPFLSIGEYGTPSPEGALDQLGINLDALVLVDRRVGDCYDEFKYDLSPSYWLLIDRNACFGLRVRVELKDSSG